MRRAPPQVPDEADNNESLKDATAMFVSFTVFGMLPVMGFVVVPFIIPDLNDHELFLCACAITAVALFGLGAFKVRPRLASRQCTALASGARVLRCATRYHLDRRISATSATCAPPSRRCYWGAFAPGSRSCLDGSSTTS